MPNIENLCVICAKRKGMTAKQLRDLGIGRDFADQCRACHVEAEWENTHSDYGHEGIANGGGDADEFGGQEEFDRVKAEMKQCWICVPDLNEAAKDYVPRAGTSRAGMRLTVSIRAAAKTKAQQVQAQLPEGFKATVRTEKGVTTLRAKGPVTIILRWNENGAFTSGTVQATDGTTRKVRNASEALRHAGV